MSLLKKIGHGEYDGLITGHRYDHRTPVQTAEMLEQREADKRAGILSRQRCEGFENEMVIGSGPLSADQLRDHASMLANEALVESAKRHTAPGVKMLIDHWLANHPDYDDGGEVGKENGQRAAFVILGATGRISPRSTADIDDAMDKLAANGLLRVKGDKKMTQDEIYVASQLALQSGRKAEPEPEPEFDEEAAYAMTTDELRQRAGGFHPLGPRN